jgi:hypothetical protein
LLNSLDQKLALGHLAEVREQNGLEEAQEPDPAPGPKERIMAIFKLTEGLGFIEIEVFKDNETCAVLGVYAARSANSIPMFRDNPSVPCFFSLLGPLVP